MNYCGPKLDFKKACEFFWFLTIHHAVVPCAENKKNILLNHLSGVMMLYYCHHVPGVFHSNRIGISQ